MAETATMTMALRVSDSTNHRTLRVPAVPGSFTISELLQRLTVKLGLARSDTHGAPLQYQAVLNRESRHLNGAETVGDALREDDEIVISPSIQAG